MIKSFRQNKDPTKVLKVPTISEVPKSITALKQKLRSSIAEILDFNSTSVEPEELFKLSLETNLGHTELLQIWNDCIMTELKKYIFKVNSIVQMKRPINLEKVSSQIAEKIEKCSSLIIEAIILVSLDQLWCLCGRKACSMRIEPEFIKTRIREYVAVNLTIDIGIGKDFPFGNVVEAEGFLFLFNLIEDEICLRISLEKIENSEKVNHGGADEKLVIEASEESTWRFLEELKIEKNYRKSCNIDEKWLIFITSKKQHEND